MSIKKRDYSQFKVVPNDKSSFQMSLETFINENSSDNAVLFFILETIMKFPVSNSFVKLLDKELNFVNCETLLHDVRDNIDYKSICDKILWKKVQSVIELMDEQVLAYLNTFFSLNLLPNCTLDSNFESLLWRCRLDDVYRRDYTSEEENTIKKDLHFLEKIKQMNDFSNRDIMEFKDLVFRVRFDSLYKDNDSWFYFEDNFFLDDDEDPIEEFIFSHVFHRMETMSLEEWKVTLLEAVKRNS